MSEIVVHGIPGSPFLRSVEMGLQEKAVLYRRQVLAPGESKGEAYLKLHPFGRIPVMEHDGFVLYETQAILRYLDDVFPEPPFEPQDPRQAARMNQIVGVNDWYLFPKVCAVVVFQRVVGPALMGLTPDEAAIAAAMPEGVRCVRELERLIGDQAFLAGERLSLADLMLAPQLDFLVATPEGRTLLQDAPRLAAWLERMTARPSMQATRRPEALDRAA
jgi:glutathione S-transferase